MESNSNKFAISDNLDQLRPYSINLDDQPPPQSTNQFQHVHAHHPATPSTGQPFVSQLLIFDFGASDVGNYSCRAIPQYSEPANVTVLALKDENMQKAKFYYSSGKPDRAALGLPLLLLTQLVLFAFR